MNNINNSKVNIQWYPGHMTKAKRMIEENILSVDAVCEVLDARIPSASSNPDLKQLAEGKPRLIVLNRCDLADSTITNKWKKYFENGNNKVIITDARSSKGIKEFIPSIRLILKDKIEFYYNKGQIGRPLRIMILGIPNVGKSTLINSIAGRKVVICGDKPGVTKGKQWISIDEGIDLLDTPGILWPKFEDQHVGELLALTNAINTNVFDVEALAANFIVYLRDCYPEALFSRYKVTQDYNKNGYELLEIAAKNRGFLLSKGEYDISRMSLTLIKEYHDGKLGKLSLEVPSE